MVALDPYFTVLKYPKASLLAVAGLYLFTIKDIRDPIFQLFGII